MTEQRRLSLSLACGLSLNIVLTIGGFIVESEWTKCILWWPAWVMFRWIVGGREGTPADPIIFIFCLIVGFFIAATIYSVVTYVVLLLTTKDEK